ncbi:ABC transporter substrate-binding protein [Thermodesulfobacteriota bacterium]
MFLKKGIIYKLGIIVFTIILISGYMKASLFAAEGESKTKLIEEAKKEGELLYYAAMNVDDATVLLNKFNKKYPFIKTKLYRTNNARLLTKLLSEFRAKRYLPDAINISIQMMTVLKESGIIGKYLSPERKSYMNGFKDPEGYWTSPYFLTYAFIYNTRLIPPEKLPKTYDDLLNPMWKGKLGYPTGNPAWFAKMLEVMGKDKGLEFMIKLAAQKLHYRPSMTLTLNMVTAGEYPAAVYANAMRTQRAIEMGAPVDWIPLEPLVASVNSIAVASHAPHPNAAKLYVDFLLSTEGQIAIRSLGRIPARKGVEPIAARLTRGLKLYPITPLSSKEYGEISKLHREIFR